ncbi:MAG: type I 3-dehydroquinate dehydratase [Deltaproteobacteria bacterium]|nr:type I 3-dehydroquinate dehydratase [Deltaproteobacteria bacterium]
MRAICVSVSGRTAEDLERALEGHKLAEVRLDLCDVSCNDIRRIFSEHPGLVATCRPGRFGAAERRERLLAAVEAGAAYVDLEVDCDQEERREIADRAGERGCRVIVSFHDFEGTPSREALEEIVSRCFEAGADVAKIACLARSPADAARLLGLLGHDRPVLAIGMGPLGKITRVAAPFLGSPFTFSSPAEGSETAPGQIPHKTLAAILREIDRA